MKKVVAWHRKYIGRDARQSSQDETSLQVECHVICPINTGMC